MGDMDKIVAQFLFMIQMSHIIQFTVAIGTQLQILI